MFCPTRKIIARIHATSGLESTLKNRFDDMNTATQDQVNTILATHNLLGAYAYFINHNPSNDLPYHNLYHTNCMIINCAEGADEMQLPPEKTCVLLLAAIFHDFGHSGGKEKDDHNIRVAIAGLEAYCRIDESFAPCMAEASQIIESTLFPPVTKPETLSQKIIRDADLMQMYMPGWEKQIFVGLRKEIEVTVGKEVSPSEMVSMQLKFMGAVQWYTSWAQARAKKEWANLVENVKQIESGERKL